MTRPWILQSKIHSPQANIETEKRSFFGGRVMTLPYKGICNHIEISNIEIKYDKRGDKQA